MRGDCDYRLATDFLAHDRRELFAYQNLILREEFVSSKEPARDRHLGRALYPPRDVWFA